MSPAAIKIAVDLSSMVVIDYREPQLLKFLQPPMRDFLVHLTVFVVEIVEFAALSIADTMVTALATPVLRGGDMPALGHADSIIPLPKVDVCTASP